MSQRPTAGLLTTPAAAPMPPPGFARPPSSNGAFQPLATAAVPLQPATAVQLPDSNMAYHLAAPQQQAAALAWQPPPQAAAHTSAWSAAAAAAARMPMGPQGVPPGALLASLHAQVPVGGAQPSRAGPHLGPPHVLMFAPPRPP